MAGLLESYVGGRSVSPEGDTVPLINAITGDEVALFPSTGLDAAAVIAYG